MKLKLALEIGKDCGLDDVGEALENIRLHAMNIFSYDSMQDEWDELITDAKENEVKADDKIDYWLSKLQ